MAEFDWSRVQPASVLEESRAHRFRPEWRPILLKYLGMAPGMTVLEVCCGPGTLAPYLAGGIAPGRVTGLDLDARFVQRAREKATEAGMENVEYVVGSACELPFAPESFDAVTSYSGVGVLNDPVRAVMEMIRVCRPKGAVSVVEPLAAASMQFQGIDSLVGQEPYPGAHRYHELTTRLQQLTRAHLLPPENLGNRRWPVQAFFALLAQSGLADLRVNAWGYAQAPDDARIPPAEQKALRVTAHGRQAQWLQSLRSGEEGELLQRHGFTREELEEVIALAEARSRWQAANPVYDWDAGVSLVVMGRKPE